MRRIIAVAQRKGGVGKTTLAVSFAAEARKRGRDVALIDGDSQMSACRWAELGNLDFPVYELPLDNCSVSDWACEVRRVVGDDIVIDTAPSDRALGAAIALADLVLAPCTPSGLDIDATARTLEIIQAVRARRCGAPKVVLVPNRVDARTLEGKQVFDELIGFGEPVSPPIGDRAAFIRAFSTGHAVCDLAFGWAADQDIRRLCDFIDETFTVDSTGRFAGADIL
jgi:chromosome partitioning protein